MNAWPLPHWIEFPSIGQPDLGYIAVAEHPKIPFEVKRVFWTFYTPQEVIRGRHAHHQLEQILIAVAGSIKVQTEDRQGRTQTFLLDKPTLGLYLPPDHWHTMQYAHTAVQLTLASLPFDESDYIRDYDVFKKG
jgi:dTDP-4-dehydrorhamnose 3,5-epimerase-like enzyme